MPVCDPTVCAYGVSGKKNKFLYVLKTTNYYISLKLDKFWHLKKKKVLYILLALTFWPHWRRSWTEHKIGLKSCGRYTADDSHTVETACQESACILSIHYICTGSVSGTNSVIFHISQYSNLISVTYQILFFSKMELLPPYLCSSSDFDSLFKMYLKPQLDC